MRNHQLSIAGHLASLLARVPVVVKDRAKKTAIIKELKSIDRHNDAMCRRITKAADALERLTVEPGTV